MEVDKRVEFIVPIPYLAFNLGEYVPNIAMHGGPEFLYWGWPFGAKCCAYGKRRLGAVNLPHEWN